MTSISILGQVQAQAPLIPTQVRVESSNWSTWSGKRPASAVLTWKTLVAIQSASFRQEFFAKSKESDKYVAWLAHSTYS